MQDRSSIHVAAKFTKSSTDHYDRSEMREYIETMLDDDGILYSTVLAVSNGDDRVTVQVKLTKAVANEDTLNTVMGVLQAMGGHLETWVLTESIMHHPELLET